MNLKTICLFSVCQDINYIVMVAMVFVWQIPIIGPIVNCTIFLRIGWTGEGMTLIIHVLIRQHHIFGESVFERCAISKHIHVAVAKYAGYKIEYWMDDISLNVKA